MNEQRRGLVIFWNKYEVVLSTTDDREICEKFSLLQAPNAVS